MDNLEEILSSLPKNKISWQTDKKIKIKLYALILKKKIGGLFVYKNNAIGISLSYKAAGIALSIILLFGATSIYAYANNDILPGSQLYPLKKAIEKIEEKIAITPAAKISAYEKFSNRRLQEAVNLSEQKNKATENIKKNIEAEVENNEAVTSSINKLDEKKAEKAVYKIKKQDQDELRSLEIIEARASAKNDQEVLEKVKEAKENIKNREYKQNKEEKKNKENYKDAKDQEQQLMESGSVDEVDKDKKSKKEDKENKRKK